MPVDYDWRGGIRRSSCGGMEEVTQEEYLVTPGFLLVGLFRSIPGALWLVGERFRFMAANERILVDTTLAEIKELTFPWYYFGCGMKFRVNSNKYRFSFAAPVQSGDDADAEGVQSIMAGRKVGKAWKARLGGREIPLAQRSEHLK